MSDVAPIPPREGLPALRYRPGTRPQVLAQMLAELVRTDTADGQLFGLRTRAADDPTVALLDAWATVADVIGFYQERIANEGFLRTATQPGSLLAIAQLVGYQPRPGLAASVWLAYQLQPDPTDTAVVLPSGLLAQSVPGTGELPQTFETTEAVVARPSWNSLGVRTTGPVTAPDGLSALSTLSFGGASTGLAANDVILLAAGETETPTPVVVQTVTVDLATQVTTVTLQSPPAPGVSAGAGPVPYAAGGSAAGAATHQGSLVTGAIDALVGGLRKLPVPPPGSAAALNRSPAEVFAPGSDAIPRLMATLDPTLAGTIYKALANTAIGPAAVTSALGLQVQATPFGVRMPPRPVFDTQGQQVGTEEWPIGDVQVLGAQLIFGDEAPSSTAQVSIQGPGGVSAQAAVDLDHLPPSFPLGDLGQIAVTVPPRAAPGEARVITIAFTPEATSGLVAMTLTLAGANDGSLTVTFADGSSFTWLPAFRAAQRFTVGCQRVTIGWPPRGTAAAGARAEGETLLTVSIAEALPLAAPTVIDLDTTYPGILPGSWVAFEQAGPGGGALTYPLVAQVVAAATTAVSRYGMSGTVTELTLDRAWVDPNARWLSAVRPLSVQAQSIELTVLPVALTGPLTGTTIDLDGLYAGIDAGHRILVTGTRSDLSAGTTVPAGERAMVAGITQGTTSGGADTPHTTLHLAAQLTYTYELGSVVVWGNVVPAHHGATVTEPLSGPVPGDPHPTFTLSQAPVLADPSPTASGSMSSLQVSVGGRTWTPVTRLTPTTPPFSYLTGLDSLGRTTIELSGSLPTGMSSVVATYRSGAGSAGNVRAHQVTQLLSRPLTVATVDNPLPGSGGSDGDGPAELRAGAPVGLASLGRLVSGTDAADLVLSWAGVGKAGATWSTDGQSGVLALTVAGVDPVALDQAGSLCTDLRGALVAAGDPGAPVLVLPANLYLILLAARVRSDPALAWADVCAALQGALVAALGYANRQLGQDVVISEIVAVAHAVPGVESFTVTAVALLPTTATASEVVALTASLPPPPADGRVVVPSPADGSGPAAASVAFLSGTVTDTLLLRQVVR